MRALSKQRKDRERLEEHLEKRLIEKEVRTLVLHHAYRDPEQAETVNRTSYKEAYEHVTQNPNYEFLNIGFVRAILGEDVLFWLGQIVIDGRGRGSFQK